MRRSREDAARTRRRAGHLARGKRREARLLAALDFREAEEVPGVVLEDRGEAVGHLLGRAGKLDAAGAQIFVGRGDVLALENSSAQRPRLDGGPQGGRGLGAGFRPLHRHEDDADVGLRLRCDGEPAEVAHAGVIAHLEAELVGVERLGAILIEHVDGGVGQFDDHRGLLLETPGSASPAGCASPKLPNPWKRRKQAGTNADWTIPGTGMVQRTRFWKSRGESPVRRAKSELNEPRLLKPTSRQVSVTLAPAASARLATSTRLHVR